MAARKVAAVIGYGPGIGHSCAALWASKGYAVALVSRTASKLETATTQIPGSAAFPCDITDNAALTTTMKSIAEKLGPRLSGLRLVFLNAPKRHVSCYGEERPRLRVNRSRERRS